MAPKRSWAGLGREFYRVFVAASSGFLFGFDVAVINGALIFLRLTEFGTEFATFALLIGCVAGASIAGYLSDRFGRRRILILSAMLFAVSSLAAALPRNLTEFTIARFAVHRGGESAFLHRVSSDRNTSELS